MTSGATLVALESADRAYVLDVLELGSIILQGPAADLAKNEDVARAYLGA